MDESGDSSPQDETERESGYTYSDLGQGEQIRFRKCAACGSVDMKPEVAYTGTGLRGGDDSGLLYTCPDCQAETRIQDPGALFMGGVYALFWGAVGAWFFYQGPYWYLTNLSYFDGSGEFDLLILDFFYFVFCLAMMALGGWFIWTFLFGPLMSLFRHPVTREISAGITGDGLGGADPAEMRRRSLFWWVNRHSIFHAMIVGFAAQITFVAVVHLAERFDAIGIASTIFTGLLWWFIMAKKLMWQAPLWLVIVFFFVFLVPTTMFVDIVLLERFTSIW